MKFEQSPSASQNKRNEQEDTSPTLSKIRKVATPLVLAAASFMSPNAQASEVADVLVKAGPTLEFVAEKAIDAVSPDASHEGFLSLENLNTQLKTLEGVETSLKDALYAVNTDSKIIQPALTNLQNLLTTYEEATISFADPTLQTDFDAKVAELTQLLDASNKNMLDQNGIMAGLQAVQTMKGIVTGYIQAHGEVSSGAN